MLSCVVQSNRTWLLYQNLLGCIDKLGICPFNVHSKMSIFFFAAVLQKSVFIILSIPLPPKELFVSVRMPLTEISVLMVLNLETKSSLHRKGPVTISSEEMIMRIYFVMRQSCSVKNTCLKKPTFSGKKYDGFYITDIRNTDMFIVTKVSVPKSNCKSD